MPDRPRRAPSTAAPGPWRDRASTISFQRRNRKSAWMYMRLLAPQCAVVVERRDALGGRHEDSPGSVTDRTNSRMSDFAAPSFQLGRAVGTHRLPPSAMPLPAPGSCGSRQRARLRRSCLLVAGDRVQEPLHLLLDLGVLDVEHGAADADGLQRPVRDTSCRSGSRLSAMAPICGACQVFSAKLFMNMS